MMGLGQKLKNARTTAALSQQTVAEKVGVSRQTISNWENNRSYPDIGSLIKLSDLYMLSLDEMLKDSTEVREHFDALAKRRKKLCHILLEAGVFSEIIGLMLTGQDFHPAGYAFAIIGAILTYCAVIGHLRHFDHTPKEIRSGTLGLVIQLLCVIGLMIWPTLSRDWLYRVSHLGGIFLLWQSGVWEMFWKSPRMWVYVALSLLIPLFSWASHLQDAGSFNQSNPFSHEYHVAEVLYTQSTEDASNIKIQLSSILGVEYQMRIAENGEDYSNIREFTYMEPIPGQTEKGIWVCIPQEAEHTLYQIAVEEDDSVTLSYSENEDLQYRYLLDRVDTAGVSIATFGKTTTMSPSWYPLAAADPEPYFKESAVAKNAKMSLFVGGLETEELYLIEEYHHGDSVEYQQYVLSANKNGNFSMKLQTRYDGQQEYALYRIAYAGGEYRFIVTFG